MRVSQKREWEERPDMRDDVGNVTVRVVLNDRRGGHVKGNLTRTFTVNDARVGDVAQVCRKACSE
jgi:hypothetical protein